MRGLSSRFSRSPSVRRLGLMGIGALFASLGLTPAPASGQMSRAQKVALLDSIAESPVLEGRVAGLAVAVVHGSDTLLMKGYGEADLEWDVPMADDAVFEIGSVTKQFTAAAVLKLRDEGKIDLDADITEYLPDYPTRGHGVTVRRLLDHTSGIRGYTEMAVFDEILALRLPRDSLVALIAAEPFDFAPGEALVYNNSGYFLLGLIIEAASGMSYEDYVEQAIFAELGMTRSAYCSNTEVVPRRAHGYQATQSGLARARYLDHTWPYAAGSLCSTAGDLVTWLRALHGGDVLSPGSYEEMITPGRLGDGTPVRYAMGLARTPDPRGRPAIQHGGGIFGFVSDTRYYPEHDLIVVVLVNTTGNLSPAAIATEMVDVLLPPAPVERRTFEGDAAPLLGTYSGVGRGREVSFTVTEAAGALAITSDEGRPAPLHWIDGWTFAVGTQLVTFERAGEAGPATVMRLDSGGGHSVLRRQPD